MLLEIPAKTEDEQRFLVLGRIDGKHWSAVMTYRGTNIRLIAVRRARTEEVELYESSTTPTQQFTQKLIRQSAVRMADTPSQTDGLTQPACAAHRTNLETTVQIENTCAFAVGHAMSNEALISLAPIW